MDGFFDLHCHMLPDVDDGADGGICALQMLEAAYDDGIRSICFTPHRNPYGDDEVHREFSEIREIYRVFTRNAVEAFPDMRFSLGSEIMYYDSCIEDIRKGACGTFCSGRRVLVEFPVDVDYSEIIRAFRRIVSVGYRPIIAHAERYECLMSEPRRLTELAAEDCIIQLNASFFDERIGFFRNHAAHAFLKTIYRYGLPFFVASDAHNTTTRPPIVSKAYSRVCETAGEKIAERAFFALPSELFGDGDKIR